MGVLRFAYRGLLPPWARKRISRAVSWGKVLGRYLLLRSPFARLFGITGVRPNALYIEGTNVCNARCVFCAYPQMQRPKGIMPMELFRAAVDQYLEMGCTEVDLRPIVGDPFADPHLFERLDYLASQAAVRGYHFYTNAILITPERAGRLVRYDGRFRVFCSFGGFDRETYHRIMGVDKLAEAVAAIRGLIEAKRSAGSPIGVQVNLRVPRGNEGGDFWEYLQGMRRAGVITLDGVEDFDNWGGAISAETLRGAGLVPKPGPEHRGPCHRLLTSPVVLADGRVNACACRDVEATLIIGDLRKESLRSILDGPRLRELIDRHARGDFPEICKSCTRYKSVYSRWIEEE